MSAFAGLLRKEGLHILRDRRTLLVVIFMPILQVVLFGYAISEERTLEVFYERLQPFAVPFMALFDRDHLPSRAF